ncbi:MAG: polysaccharide biosynthesis/export family protein [Hyphomonadaceae bacterium]
MAMLAVLIAAGFAGCAATARAQDASAPASVQYGDESPAYRFYPGDDIEITVFSAPELSRTVTVAPDGRISLPLIQPVRAADLTAAELHDVLVAAYAPQLRAPELSVTPRTYASRQVFVGGEVARPGIYEMPANIDAFQAVALAGGFLPTARRGEVLHLSRAGGATEVSELDLSERAFRRGAGALRRHLRAAFAHRPGEPVHAAIRARRAAGAVQLLLRPARRSE